MNINTLTVKAQEALQSALTLARERGQQAVEPLHILSVLVREDDSLATFLLGRVGVNVRGLRDEADRAVASLPRVEGGGDQFFSQDSSKVIQRAVDFTRNFGDKYASVEHLLLAGSSTIFKNIVDNLRNLWHTGPATWKRRWLLWKKQNVSQEKRAFLFGIPPAHPAPSG